MALSLDDLTTPVTVEQALEAQYATLAAVGTNTSNWKPGAVVRTILAGMAIIIAAFSAEIARIARLGFLALSTGDWLTLVAQHVYGVIRIDATFATGEITLTNGGGGIYTIDPDDLIFLGDNAKTYRNTTGFTLGAGPATTITIPIQATEAGQASSAQAGSIHQFVTPLLNVTCTNAKGLTGADAESDSDLRTRCSEKLGSLSPMGPWDAYSYAARNAVRPDDGSSIGITRVRIAKTAYGTVTVYVATATGGVTSPDLAIVDDEIQRKAAPLAVTATAASANEITFPVTYEVWAYESSRTPADIQAACNAAITSFIHAQPIGGNVIGTDPGKIFVSAIVATIIKCLPEIFQAVVTLPAGDTVMGVNDVAVPGTLTNTAVHRVPTPEGTVI